MTDNHIVIQAYHSGSLVGNHCHKYLQPKVFTDLCMTGYIYLHHIGCTDKQILEKAAEINTSFFELNSLYSDIHHKISSTSPINDNEIEDAQKSINRFTKYVREVPGNIIPKMHILENHATPFMSRTKHQFGLYVEQGIESVHAEVNIIT